MGSGGAGHPIDVTPGATPEIIWEPPVGARERSRMGRWLGWLERERSLAFETYDDAWHWSVEDLTEVAAVDRHVGHQRASGEGTKWIGSGWAGPTP